MYAAKALTALILGFGAPYGITGEMSVESFLTYLFAAIVTAAGVYLVPNKK